jgi:hypothetical protein
VSINAFRNAGFFLAVMGLTAATALLLALAWPWLAWGYAIGALAVGVTLELLASRAERSHARIDADEPARPAARAPSGA